MMQSPESTSSRLAKSSQKVDRSSAILNTRAGGMQRCLREWCDLIVSFLFFCWTCDRPCYRIGSIGSMRRSCESQVVVVQN